MTAPLYLVEVDTALRARRFSSQEVLWSSTTVILSDTTLRWSGKNKVGVLDLSNLETDSPVLVTAVTEDGTAMTKKTTAAAVETEEGTWYYAVATRTLTIHSSSAVKVDRSTSVVTTETYILFPSGLVITVLEPLYFRAWSFDDQGDAPVKLRDGLQVNWRGRVLGMPSIEQSIALDELGAGSVYALGALVLDNADGRYDRICGQRLLAGQEVRVLRGDPAAGYGEFTTWARGVMLEPQLTQERVTLYLVSLAAFLDKPISADVFAVADYPGMDANITGLPIPRVFGSVTNAPAYRIASGRWKVSADVMASITSCVDQDNAAVTITGTDTDLGEFTVSATYDTEDRLYVTCRGAAVDGPGAHIKALARDAGIADSRIDLSALDALDAARDVDLGYQCTTETYRDYLNIIARSAFIDWVVRRDDVLTAVARSLDPVNLVPNAGFETDAAGWNAYNGGVILRFTTYGFRGSARLRVTSDGVSALSGANVNVNFAAGRRYTASLMLLAETDDAGSCRTSLRDSGGSEQLSEVTSNTPRGLWHRHTASFRPTGSGAYWSSRTIRFSASGTYVTRVLADVPLGYWHLGETGGGGLSSATASDSSGNRLHGTYNASATQGQATLVYAGDASISVDGTNAGVTVAGVPAMTRLTLEAWVNVTDLSVSRGILGAGVTRYLRVNTTGRVVFTWLDAAGVAQSLLVGADVYNLVIGRTYHVAATHDGTTMRVFIDGLERASSSQSLEAVPSLTWSLGASTGATSPMNGQVDEPAIYDAALTADQIWAHYAAGAPVGSQVAQPTFATAGGTLQFYPHNAAIARRIAIDEVWLSESTRLDDVNAELVSSQVAGLVLDRVRVMYALDGRTGQGRWVEQEDAALRYAVKAAESRDVPTALVAAADATTVATAILDYYRPRMRATYRVYDTSIALEVGGAVELQTSRAPTLPDQNRLYKIVGWREDHPEQGDPSLEVECEARLDPEWDIRATTAVT